MHIGSWPPSITYCIHSTLKNLLAMQVYNSRETWQFLPLATVVVWFAFPRYPLALSHGPHEALQAVQLLL